MMKKQFLGVILDRGVGINLRQEFSMKLLGLLPTQKVPFIATRADQRKVQHIGIVEQVRTFANLGVYFSS